MRCDVIAEGIIAAAKELNMKTPIVCRLQVCVKKIISHFICYIIYTQKGTNVNEAKQLIQQSKLKILPRDDLDEAANLAVHLAQIVHLAREVKMDVNFEFPEYAK